MKHRIAKIASVLLLIVLSVQLLSDHFVCATKQDDEAYYGEAYLDLQSEEHRLAYRMIEEGIAGLAPRIEFKGIVQINYKQMANIIQAVCVDHPQYFWFLEQGSFIYGDITDGGHIVSFDPLYILDGEEIAVGSQELADAMYAFHTKVQEIIRSIPVNLTTEYEVAMYLHDYLANQVTYTLEGEHPSAYAALIHGQAACYGYSKAYQCLLNAAGIRARTITGTSDNGSGKPEGHAWNQVWLGEDCYYVDVTWDDFDSVILHSYFMVPLQTIEKDHFAGKEFVLPACSHETIDPYRMDQEPGMAYAEYSTSAAQVAPFFEQVLLADSASTFACEIRYKGSDFLKWVDWIGYDLIKQLGLSDSTKLYYYKLSDAYYLQLRDSHYKMQVPVISAISLEETEISLIGPGRQYRLAPRIQTESIWTPNLVYTSSDPSVALVDQWGLITAVAEGSAVITLSSADGSVQTTCTVTVAAAEEHVHTMRRFTSKQPTCIQDGYETHYLCTGCGIRFADEGGAQALTETKDFIFPATGHQQYAWEKKMDYHVEKCACGYEKPNTTGNHVDTDGDGNCDVCQGVMPEEILTKPKEDPKNQKQQEKVQWLIPVIICLGIVAAVVTFFVIRKRRRDSAITPF